jgi:hypothetical protein
MAQKSDTAQAILRIGTPVKRPVGFGLDRLYDRETRYPDGAWERFKNAVKRGWERTTAAVERAIPGDSDRDGR